MINSGFTLKITFIRVRDSHIKSPGSHLIPTDDEWITLKTIIYTTKPKLVLLSQPCHHFQNMQCSVSAVQLINAPAAGINFLLLWYNHEKVYFTLARCWKERPPKWEGEPNSTYAWIKFKTPTPDTSQLLLLNLPSTRFSSGYRRLMRQNNRMNAKVNFSGFQWFRRILRSAPYVAS